MERRWKTLKVVTTENFFYKNVLYPHDTVLDVDSEDFDETKMKKYVKPKIPPVEEPTPVEEATEETIEETVEVVTTDLAPLATPLSMSELEPPLVEEKKPKRRRRKKNV